MKFTFVSKSDLAIAYFPHVGTHSACNKLMSIIKDDQELHSRLLSTGYRKLNRTFTPKQVEMIVERLGKPY